MVSSQSDVPANFGIVVGKFSVPPNDPTGASSRKLEVVNLASGETFFLPFREADSDDDSRSAPFLASLPIGHYGIRHWEITSGGHDLWMEIRRVGFSVAPGVVTCLGNLQAVRQGLPAVAMSDYVYIHIGLVVRNDCAKLGSYVHTVAPNLRAPLVTSLPRR